MATYDFDMITIGAGSGGVAASRRAGSFGARVALCEVDRVGGTCVLRGCVPKKILMYGASFAESFADSQGFGWNVANPQFEWARLQQNKEAELTRLNGIYHRMLNDSGVTLFMGHAHLRDAHTVTIGDRTLTAEHILIATGGWPSRPEFPGQEFGITSNEALSFPELPRRLIVIGAGYIGVEMACIFHALGVEVTLLSRSDLPLRGFDEDVRAHLAAQLTAKGIRMATHRPCDRVERAGNGSLELRTSKGELLVADQVLLATGRAPNTAGLGLVEAGVQLNSRGAVLVDSLSRSSIPSIFAIGDCTDRVNLTPVAVAEGRAVAETLFRNNPTPMDYRNVPTAVFSMPPVGSIGLTEEAALSQHGPLDIYATAFRPLKNAISGRGERTFMKIIVEQKSQRVLGCHMVGPDAPEIIQGLAVALTAGATKADFDRTIALHPTAAEEFVLMRDRRPPPAPGAHK